LIKTIFIYITATDDDTKMIHKKAHFNFEKRSESYLGEDDRVNPLNVTIPSHAHADALGSISVASIRSIRSSCFLLPKVATIGSLVPFVIVESSGILVVSQWHNVATIAGK
jgi:hypothetical protein